MIDRFCIGGISLKMLGVMTEITSELPTPGIPAARAHLMVARIAAGKYLSAKERNPTDRYDLMLYYGAFFLFARSALYAVENSDGRENPKLNDLQRQYFKASIKQHPVFFLLKNERDRISHGDDSWANHPFRPASMLARFIEAGLDWTDAVFEDFWPEEPFRGKSVEDVMDEIWKTVSDWLDEIDVRDVNA